MPQLGIGVVHPPGEGEDYDGLYYRQTELKALAQELVGKPLRIEHLPEGVGTIRSAWVGQKTPELYALFETNDHFNGLLAKNLIQKGVCKDLSLGHNVLVDNDQVIGKEAIEVSICAKGARPHTHIYAFSTSSPSVPPSVETKSGKYILEVKNSLEEVTRIMSEETVEPTPTPTEQETQSPAVLTEIMEQMKQQQSDLVALQQQLKASEEARSVAEKQVAASNKRKREERSSVIEGTLKDYVKKMMATYKSELGPYADSLQQMFEGMKDSEQSEPMLKLLSCAASSHGSNTAKLEEQYQAQKKLKSELTEHQKKLSNLSTPAFSAPTERFVEPPAQKAAARLPMPSLPSGIQLPRASRAGMQTRNPDLWAQLTSSSAPTRGMGWFKESNLVGKEYADGRRPKPVA